jgi:predicted NBD/HSP70 family sugar kinase
VEQTNAESWVVVGIDNGGTANNATVLEAGGSFLVDALVETPSRVQEGPAVAIQAMVESFEGILTLTRTPRERVRAIGLDTPGPAGPTGVIAAAGSTNFAHPEWGGFDVRLALEQRLHLPVVYLNDANAAALYAHHQYFGPAAGTSSSVAAIVGTGLGGGVVEDGRVVIGAAGMAGELGHIPIPMHDILGPDQPLPQCNCGLQGDVESIASLTGITKNLLPYWLPRFPSHPLAEVPIPDAARRLRGYAEKQDPLALTVFGQQAQAIAHLFTLAAGFTDPLVYFIGGGVVEAAPVFRDWFLEQIRTHTRLRPEQAEVSAFALVPDRDLAGARGSAVAARDRQLSAAGGPTGSLASVPAPRASASSPAQSSPAQSSLS